MLAKQFGFNENLLTPVRAETTSWKARRPVDSSLNVSKAQRILTNKPIALSEALKSSLGNIGNLVCLLKRLNDGLKANVRVERIETYARPQLFNFRTHLQRDV